jgi:hypothetical protein
MNQVMADMDFTKPFSRFRSEINTMTRFMVYLETFYSQIRCPIINRNPGKKSVSGTCCSIMPCFGGCVDPDIMIFIRIPAADR